jgi:hypothetical protein
VIVGRARVKETGTPEDAMRRFLRPLGITVVAVAAVSGAALADRGGPNENANWHAWWNHDRPYGTSAPEIAPGMLSGTVALLAGGLMMLRDRRRR